MGQNSVELGAEFTTETTHRRLESPAQNGNETNVTRAPGITRWVRQ